MIRKKYDNYLNKAGKMVHHTVGYVIKSVLKVGDTAD